MGKGKRNISKNKSKSFGSYFSNWWKNENDDFNNKWYTKPASRWFNFTPEPRQQLVYPNMISYDSKRLYDNVYTEIYQLVNTNSNGRGNKSRVAQSTADLKNPDLFAESKDLISTIKAIIPQHLVEDIYNLFFHKSGDQEFVIIGDTNKGKFNLLQLINDSSLKIMTNGSVIVSTIFTKEICLAIVRALLKDMGKQSLTKLAQCMNSVKAERRSKEEDNGGDNTNSNEEEDEEDDTSSVDGEDTEDISPNMGNSSGGDTKEEANNPADSTKPNGEGSGNGEGEERERESNDSVGASKQQGVSKDPKTVFEELIDELANNHLTDEITKAKNTAFTKISDLEKNGLDLQSMDNSSAENILKIINNLDTIKSELKELSVNHRALRPIIEKILDTSISYFSSKSKTKEIDILESDNFDEIEGLEYLHPVLKNIKLDEVITRENKYYGKINIYVDVSGSMDSSVVILGKRVSTMTFAKSLCITLMDMNIISKIIPFGDNIKKPIDPPNLVDILLLNAHCGTNIDKVVEHCEANAENSLVITDCQDHIRKYSNYCFILGTPGASFHLSGPASELDINNQLYLFNDEGTDIVEHSKKLISEYNEEEDDDY